MTTHDALLADILAKPDDDLPRLVYADWCDENGQPERAEFIRVQVEIAGRCGTFQAPPLSDEMRLKLEEIQPLRDVERELFHTYGWPWWFTADSQPDGWFDDLPAPDGQCRVRLSYEEYDSPFPTYTVTRGFMSEVRCTLADWCGIGPAVVRAHPVGRVVFTSGVEMFEVGVRSGWFWGVQQRWHGDPIVTGLVRHPYYPWQWGKQIYGTREDAERGASDHFIAWAESQDPHSAENAHLDAMFDDAMSSPSY